MPLPSINFIQPPAGLNVSSIRMPLHEPAPSGVSSANAWIWEIKHLFRLYSIHTVTPPGDRESSPVSCQHPFCLNTISLLFARIKCLLTAGNGLARWRCVVQFPASLRLSPQSERWLDQSLTDSSGFKDNQSSFQKRKSKFIETHARAVLLRPSYEIFTELFRLRLVPVN